MTRKLKWWFFDNHLQISGLLLIFVFTVCMFVSSFRSCAVLFPAVATILGFNYFVFKQHLEETHLFKELFTEFNRRYDELNGPLYALLSKPPDQPLTAEETTLLYDYFNLCAEEFLYYRKGFIYPVVWEAWCNGMRIFYADPRIRALWEMDSGTLSYYGFTATCLRGPAI